VKLADTVTGPTDGFFFVEIVNADGCVAQTETFAGVRLNVDDVAAHSSSDQFNAAASVWTAGGDAVGFVQERATPLDGIWRGRNIGVRSDTHLRSPTLDASATEPVVVTFKHRHIFELGSFDGGFIEISTDGGATFQDVTTRIPSSPYNGTITTSSDNPQAGRAAYVNTSVGHPNEVMTTLDFANTLAGTSFQLRFRVTTDGGVGAPGWEIDDLEISGITNKPFPAQIANQGSCAQPQPPDGAPDAGVNPMPDAGETPDAGQPLTGEGGGCCDAGPVRPVNALVMLGVLGLLSWPRRRRRR
jgi:hypothetical protein